VKKFNMQNVFVWVIPKRTGGYKWRYTGNHERIFNYLKLQIHNSIDLGWPIESIIPITNFPFEHMGVKAYELDGDLYNWSAFSNRMVSVNEMIEKKVINDNFWVHDLDAYQLVPFDFPESCKGVSFTRHAPRRIKPQGASVFYRKDTHDLVKAMAESIPIFRVKKEESFFPKFFCKSNEKDIAKLESILRGQKLKLEDLSKSSLKPDLLKSNIEKIEKEISSIELKIDIAKKYFSKFSDKFSWLNWEYNLCHQRMFDQKYPKATKPIKVVHCKMESESVVNCFYNGKNSLKLPIITDRLEELLFKYDLIDPRNKREISCP